MLAKQYHDDVHSLILELRREQRPVVIFGASRCGWYIEKVFNYFGVPVVAFADNDPSKTWRYSNTPVLLPVEVARQYPDASISIGVFSEPRKQAISKQLQSLNLKETPFLMDAFLFFFFIEIAGRECDKEGLARSINILFRCYRKEGYRYGNVDGYFVSPSVTGVITQKCSLRCRDCGQRIPYYRSPVNFPVKNVTDDIAAYARAFDIVPEMSLNGGEPFLHPDVGQICSEVSRIPNIIFISFVTNGTILPSTENLQHLSRSAADVRQSDYGQLSRKQNELFNACYEQNIYCYIHYINASHMWARPSPVCQSNRTNLENDLIFKSCISSEAICCQIMDGELHRCPFSMHATHQRVLPVHKSDFVWLNDPDKSDVDKETEIRSFISRSHSLKACDFCDPAYYVEVPPAIQL